jgi:uncharacterized protein YkwD
MNICARRLLPFCGIISLVLVVTILAGCSGAATTAATTPVTTAPITTLPPATQPPTTTAVITTTAAPVTTTQAPPTTTVQASPTMVVPTTIYVPTVAPYTPTADELVLFKYALDLINADRAAKGLSAVTLGFNAAAQLHAKDMLTNNYLAHWGTDGKKPYMRYTDAGGLNYEGENSAYSSGSDTRDPKREIKALEEAMMAEGPGGSHYENILNPRHKKVSIGVASSSTTVALVHQFEGDYVEYFQPPTLTGSVLSLSGRFKQAGLKVNNVAITYDPLPQPISGPDLMNGPYHSYGQGSTLGQVFPPPPPNAQYPPLPAGSVIAQKGYVDEKGNFALEANISSIMKGPGVYTVNLIAVVNNKAMSYTNYSITVK